MSYTLGLGGGYWHDASACLVGDGAVIAFAEEERFSRRKHNADSRSCARATAYCLDRAGIQLADVNEISVGWNARWPDPVERTTDAALIRELLPPSHFGGYTPSSIRVLPHHLAHAASAFYCSGMAEAAVLVADGSGDGVSTSIWRGSPNGLQLLREYPFTQSLGWVFESVAQHVGLGAWTNAGKLMGLAGYGEPRYELPFLRTGDDGYRLDLSAYGLRPDEDADTGYLDLSYYHRLKAACGKALTDAGVPVRSVRLDYDRRTGATVNRTEFDRAAMDVAASVQARLEECMVALARYAMTLAATDTLCLAGGVALSCSANGVVRRESGARDIFVQPVAGDGGLAVGGALEMSRECGALALPTARLTSVAWGPEFDEDNIGELLARTGLAHEYVGEKLPERVAHTLDRGGVVGWFQGAMEGGPRALGQRSILGDPRSVAVRDRINRHIKHRELWRPLAPSILHSSAVDLVDDLGTADFMIVAYRATAEAAQRVPGVVHVDGTLRPQVLPTDAKTPYAALLRACGEVLGVAAVLNTSFNNESEPIVCTPTDAVRTFCSSQLDQLAIGPYLVTKENKQQ